MISAGLDPYTDASVVLAGKDLTGRTAIVTGGATGIGIETVKALAAAGAEVVIAVRKPDLGAAAAKEVNAAVGAQRATVGLVDLADLSSVAAFTRAWGDRPLHILVNNAGVMACPLSYTADDLEMQIGTNHFGHFALGIGLAQALMNGAEDGRASRLVSLSSIGHLRSAMNFEDPNYRARDYDKWAAYGQSKTANALFAVGFDKRFADRGVRANSVMPGGIFTPLQRHLPHEEQVAMGWFDAEGKPMAGFKTPAQGASTSVWAAVGDELEGVGGLYLENLAEAAPYQPGNRFGVAAHALDPEAAERLWALSEETTGVRL